VQWRRLAEWRGKAGAVKVGVAKAGAAEVSAAEASAVEASAEVRHGSGAVQLHDLTCSRKGNCLHLAGMTLEPEP
tara:strand:+ start:263 stop:487 length:225 start_codon:yes stop_codon:yes gene_type:complete